MGLKLNRVWSGPIKDLPEKYMKEGIPEDSLNVTIYSDGSRVYDKGFNPSEEQIALLNKVFSRCWDSLTLEQQITINNKIDDEV